MTMVMHDREPDIKGVGKWDLATTRYIPLYGGSRSRLPLWDDKAYPRYVGFVGVDEHLSDTLYTMPALYAWLGGAPAMIEGHGSVFVSLIWEATQQHLREEKEESEKH